jgi:beta-glucosidase
VKQTGEHQADIAVRITNTGKREGAEVVQLYLSFPPAAEEPPKQLKGFEKIMLKPGESKTVTMKLDKDSLSAWDSANHRWKIYPGAYSIMVGSSSRDLRLKSDLVEK